MPDWLLFVHSIFRWVVLLEALGAIALAAMAAAGSRPWDRAAALTSFTFTLAMDIQTLIGLALWFLGNWWKGDPLLAFGHPLAMLAAVALAHVGRVRSEREPDSRSKGRTAALFFTASIVVVLAAIPLFSWPL